MGLAVGDSAEMTRSFTREDVEAYVAFGGDRPPLGLAPEPLVAAMFSKLLGVDLPGPGTNYLKQELRFTAAAKLGQPLFAKVEVTALRPDKGLVDLEATCTDLDGGIICSGRALVVAKDVKDAFAP